MAKFIRFGESKRYYAVDAIEYWSLTYYHTEGDWNISIQIPDNDVATINIGYYPNREAVEAAVIHAMGLPGIVGVVPYGHMEAKHDDRNTQA